MMQLRTEYVQDVGQSPDQATSVFTRAGWTIREVYNYAGQWVIELQREV